MTIIKEYPVCIRCGRKLKNPESRELGFGKVCYEKWQAESLTHKLFTKEDIENAPQQSRYDAQAPGGFKQ